MVFVAMISLVSSIYLIASCHPIFTLLLFAISLTLGTITLNAWIFQLIPRESMGLCLGMYRCTISASTVIFNGLVGILQDQTQDPYTHLPILFHILILSGFGPLVLSAWMPSTSWSGGWILLPCFLIASWCSFALLEVK